MVLEVHYVSKLYKKVGRVENEKYIIFALADPILSGRDDERLICLYLFDLFLSCSYRYNIRLASSKEKIAESYLLSVEISLARKPCITY